jgi:protein O-mannosyl-transferase
MENAPLRITPKQLATALALPFLLALAALLLWPGVYGPFLFDDVPNLQNLREINGELTRRNVGHYLSLFTGTPGRPLSALTFLLNDFAWPSEPLGFKITNLLIHLLNGVLVFGLVRTLSNAYGGDRSRNDLIALLAAAIWLLHPIQISSVFLTVQRMAQLAGTFMFAGLWAYAALVMRAHRLLVSFAALAVLGLATVLGVLAKENAVLLPLLALIAHLTLLRRPIAALPALPRRFLQAGLYTGVALILLMFSSRFSGMTSFANRDFTMAERVMTQGRVLWNYVSMILLPRLSGSSLYNDDFTVSRGWLSPATTLPAAIGIVSLLALAAAMHRRAPIFAFAVLWFFGAHLIESSVFPLEIYFEHRNYVPLLGPAFAIAYAALHARGKLVLPATAGVLVWLGMLAGMLHLQARTWGSEDALAVVWHNDRPSSLRANQEYARYLLRHGRNAEAHEVMRQAAERGINPADTHLQALTLSCLDSGQVEPADVLHAGELLSSHRLAPGTALILGQMRLVVQRGRCPDGLSAEAWLWLTDQVLNNPRGRNLRRMLRVERAELYLFYGELDGAINELERTWSRTRPEPRVAFYAAALLASAGRYSEARGWAERPLSLPWSWKRWLAMTNDDAISLLDAIDRAEAEQAEAPTSEADSSRP